MADIKEDCCCPNKDCPRHGKCRECVEFHVAGGNKPPACLRVQWKEYPRFPGLRQTFGPL